MSRNPDDIVRQRSISPNWRALHALHCCRVIRAQRGDREFGQMVERGFAIPTFPTKFPSDSGKVDYRITPRGETLARELF